MTYRELINSVLRRLREDTISSDWSGDLVSNTTSSDYQKLIGDFVNEAKRDVEDAWDWSGLRQTVTVNTVNDTMTYILTGAKDRSRIYDVVDTSLGSFIPRVSDHYLNRAFYPTSNQTNGRPIYYGMAGIDSNGDKKIQFYPKPDGVYTVNVNIIDPATEMENATDSLSVPTEPVILGAWARAISERGEDGGSQSGDVYAMYTKSLSDHIAIDANHHQSELTWESH